MADDTPVTRAPEANVRAAYTYLSDMVRKFAGHSSLTLLNKLRVAEIAEELGPQVARYSADGLCLYCGRREHESGYFTCEDCNNLDNDEARARAIAQHKQGGVSAGYADTSGARVPSEQTTVHAVDRVAERLAAALALALYEGHPSYGSTTGRRGGIGGSTITQRCSFIDPPPGVTFTQGDMLSKPLREFLEAHPFDLEKAQVVLRAELEADLRD